MIQIDHSVRSRNPKLGFYEYKNNIYWNKAEALITASAAGAGFNDVAWNFNRDAFNAVDWTVEPPGTLQSYYHQRARDLREQYDYLLLNFSGGSDSTNIVNSFLDQNLLLDEVVVRYAGAGVSQFGNDSTNTDAKNEFSEFEYAAVPILKQIQARSPKTKITIHDYSKDLLNDKLYWDENFIYWCGDFITPANIVRYTHNTQLDHLRLFDTGKSIGIIFGCDKPHLIQRGNELGVVFSDRPVSGVMGATANLGYDNTTIELFYWTPDFPEMLAKQSHIVKRWAMQPENKQWQYIFDPTWRLDAKNRTLYEHIIKGIVYPDYDINTFQCDKPSRPVLQEWDHWILSHTTGQAFKTYRAGVRHLANNINDSFITGNIKDPKLDWSYTAYRSPFYSLGIV